MVLRRNKHFIQFLTFLNFVLYHLTATGKFGMGVFFFFFGGGQFLFQGFFWVLIFAPFILGDPGAESGGEEKSKRAGKYCTKKSKERREELLGTMSYQTSSKRSPPFWLLIGARQLFFRPFRLSLAPSICPWVSEDGPHSIIPVTWNSECPPSHDKNSTYRGQIPWECFPRIRWLKRKIML